MKDIVLLSQCILNTASKVCEPEENLTDEYRKRNELLNLIFKNNIQMIQLPCPEFMLYGSQRWGHVKEQFENPFYRIQSQHMLEPIILQLEEYLKHPDQFQVLGLVSVEGSPSCSSRLTCRSRKCGGEIGSDKQHIAEIQNDVKMVNDSGAFMDIILEELTEHKLSIPILTMDDAINKLS